MKIRHLLLGLMICAAGTGAIDLSGGFLDDQNATQLTPFLIFGHVWYEGGAPCNSPNVSITNTNTGVAWYADTVFASNYYQILLRAADVNVSDVIRWNATDGAVVNTTNRTIIEDDLNNKGVFEVNLTLESPPPTTSQPASPFVICGWVIYTNGATCDAPVVNITNLNTSTRRRTETHEGCGFYELILNSANVGIGNLIEFNATDDEIFNITNHTITEGNLNSGGVFDLNLTLTSVAPRITGYSPNSSVHDIKNATRRFNITIGQTVNVTWWINDSQVQTNTSATNASYTHTSALIGVWNVSAIATNENGTDVQTWIWNVTAPPAPNITSFAPPSHVRDTENVTRTFNITVDQTVNVTWLINGTEVFNETNVNESTYTNTSAAGIWNVTAVASNQNGTDTQEWIWRVTSQAQTSPVPFVICGYVTYEEDGTPCDSPYVVVTNLNSSEELVADNRTGTNFYQTITNSTFVGKCDTLQITASKNGTPVGNATHIVTLPDTRRGVIYADINAGMPDFNVTNLTFDPPEPLIGDLITINATIANAGGEGEVSVEMYDNKSITIDENDTLTLPGALKIRVHFESYDNNNITIHNETQLVEELTGSGADRWTEWCDGATIRIESEGAEFTVDRYDAMLANETILIGSENSTNVPVVWNLSDQFMGWAYNGTHNITVMVDRYNLVVESDETNNEKTEAVCVNASLDFAVINISLNKTEPVLGDLVGVNATVKNFGNRTGTALVRFWVDSEVDGEIPIANETVTLVAGDSKVVSVSWLTGVDYGGARNHSITAEVNPDKLLVETNEANNTRTSEQVFVNGTDLTVTMIEMPCGLTLDNRCYIGQDVNVTATIANIGAADATNVTVEFKDGTNRCNLSDVSKSNTSGAVFNNVHIDRLNASENITVSVIWNPEKVYRHTITANVTYNITDNTEENNELYTCSRVKARYDLSVEGVSVDPPTVKKGGSVNITAILNCTGSAGGNVSIAFFANSTDFAGTCGERFIRIGSLDDEYLEVNEPKTVSIQWDVDVVGGCHLIVAVINPDNELTELNSNDVIYLYDTIRFRNNSDNVKNCTLHVYPLDLSITDVTLEPSEPESGDLVDVTAGITNNDRGSDADSTVSFYMERREEIPRSIALDPEFPIRVHFDYVDVNHWNSFRTSVTDRQGDDHGVGLYIKCDEYGGQYVKTDGINYNHTAYEDEDIYEEWGADKRHWKRWYDVWTEWVNGTAININGGSISIDKYQVLLGNETVTLSAGDSGRYDALWNTSVPLGPGTNYIEPEKNYTIVAVVEDKNESRETYLKGTDLAITNLSIKPVIYDSDQVWVNATIANLGRMNATEFIVTVTEVYHPADPDDKCKYWQVLLESHELLNTTHISGLMAGKSINISTQWNASIREIVCECETGVQWIEIADDYTIDVTINPLENYDHEGNRKNHKLPRNVPVHRSHEFNVTNLSFMVNGSICDPMYLDMYDDLTLNATVEITNLVNQGGSVNLSFYLDETEEENEIGNCSITFPAGNGTEYAEIKWNVWCTPGEHDLIVRVDPPFETINFTTFERRKYPEGEIHEINETNNNFTWQISVHAPELVLESLDVNPIDPMRREDVEINLTIANIGKMNASDVNLTIYDWRERHIENVDMQWSGWGWRYPMKITREDADAIRLYLDLEVGDESGVCVRDSAGKEIICYYENFHGWTPWVLDNSVTITRTMYTSVWVGKVYSLASGGIISTSSHDLSVNDRKNITVIWNTSFVGERFIAAVIDSDDKIAEYNESDNRLAEFISVQTADLLVSDLSFSINGTEIGKSEIIKHGENVNITVDLANIGVDDADDFNMSFFIDHRLIGNETIPDLANGSTRLVSADWNAVVGDHLIQVEADRNNSLDETNETNNIVSMDRYVCGANLSGNISWRTLGLDGNLLGNPDQPYDEDEVVINATVTNSGCVPATNFSVVLSISHPSNTTSIRVDGINLSADGSYNISMKRNVSAGDYRITLSIDPDRNAPEDEDHREDNVISETMPVLPTRDFTVTSVTAACTNLSDLDNTTITAEVANIGLRNGTADVTIVDYENESRAYKYHFDPNQTLSYLPIPPDASLYALYGYQYNVSLYDPDCGTETNTCPVLLNYDNLTIIHRPRVDAIELHLSNMCIGAGPGRDVTPGAISVYDKDDVVPVRSYIHGAYSGSPDIGSASVMVPGDTAYIHSDNASFNLDRYTTWWNRELHSEEMRLNASKTVNESKNITLAWTVNTGDRIIAVTIDRDGNTTEIDESNNKNNSSTFHVSASREPVLLDLNFTPYNPDDGDDVAISAVVANNGTRVASFTVDLWADTTRDKDAGGADITDYNLTYDRGDDGIGYIRLLKHANLTLEPGENVTVDATWHGISLFGDPTHRVIAIIDPTDEIDEADESNNEIEKEIVMNYPDFTIGNAYVPGGADKAVVNVKESGGASTGVFDDVTVRFEAYETVEYDPPNCRKCGRWISHPGANNMQIHFKYIDARKGWVEVYRSISEDPIVEYHRDDVYYDEYTPGINGSRVYIHCEGDVSVCIKGYNWGNVSDEVVDLPAGGSEEVEIPFVYWEYEHPKIVNVTVDPDNNITELKENNNNESVLMYADLMPYFMAYRSPFISPKKTLLSLDAPKFKIEGYITNGGSKDGIVCPVSDFNVTLEFRRRYPNGTDSDPVFNVTEHVDEPLYGGKNNDRVIRFEIDTKETFEVDRDYIEVDGNYSMWLIVDSSMDVCEANEVYKIGEDNNVKVYSNYGDEIVHVHLTSGYTGGGELINVAEGEVNGRVVYTLGDCTDCNLLSTGTEKIVRYTDVIPDDAGDIEFARLFVYWYSGWDEHLPLLAGMDVTFNGHDHLTKAGNYSDNPGATYYEAGYGLYSYDVTDYVTKGENQATALITSNWQVGIHAISLLVAYEDCDEPLTKYWINEGADIMMAENPSNPTGLPDGDCITTATFEGVEQNDTENVDATLLTVLGFYAVYVGIGDALEFNNRLIGTNHWVWHSYDTGIALTPNEWDDVTDCLQRGDNLVEFKSLANYMMPNNAFLRLIFPPDLNVIDLTAPASTVVGAHHSINATIRNDGRSDAHDFNVIFYIDGKQMIRIPRLDLPAGENMTLHLYNWTPMLLMHSYNLTAAADVLSGADWTEVETDNNALTKHVPIEEGGFGNQTGPKGPGGGGKPTGGKFPTKVTGRKLTSGIISSIIGGGGGAGMFSLTEWLMKGAVWLVLLLFVYLGYWMEQRSWGRARYVDFS